MNVDDLCLLVEVIDAEGFSEAARRLDMTRANVSYRIGRFERSVGAQLLRRTTRRLEPTEVGRSLYDRGRAILDELRIAKESIAMLSGTLRGMIRVAVPSGYGQVVMTDWFIAFKKMYPDVVLEVIFDNRLGGDPIRDDIDFAVRVMDDPPPSVVARQLGSVRYLACASEDFARDRGLPRDLDELKTFPVISSSMAGRRMKLAARRNGQPATVLLEPSMATENSIFMRSAVLAGMGIGIFADYMVRGDLDAGRMRRCLDEFELNVAGTRRYLVYMPNRQHTLTAATFIQFVLDMEAARNVRVSES